MNTILDQLHEDHKNFIKLLEFMDDQASKIEKGEHADLESLLCAVQYMKEYPDLVHHPLEELVFDYFKSHHNDLDKELHEIKNEHETMPSLTEKLYLLLDGAIKGHPESREILFDYLIKYISIQKEHMNEEEGHVYPTIRSTLTDDEWNEFDSELTKVEDPLFGNNVEKCYQGLLYKVIG